MKHSNKTDGKGKEDNMNILESQQKDTSTSPLNSEIKTSEEIVKLSNSISNIAGQIDKLEWKHSGSSIFRADVEKVIDEVQNQFGTPFRIGIFLDRLRELR